MIDSVRAGRTPSGLARRRGRRAAVVAALAGVLLFGAGTAQAQAGPGTASPSAQQARTSKVYLTVTPETARTVPGGKARIRRPAKRADAGPFGVSTPIQPISVDECLAHASSSSHGNGWAKGRFDSCQSFRLHTWHVECEWLFGCSTVGTADADLVDIQYTDDGDRTINVEQYIGGWTPVGDMTGISLTVDTTCSASQGSGPCTTDYGQPTTELVDEWTLSGAQVLYYQFQQPSGTGLGPDDVSYANLSWHLTAEGGENGPATRGGPASHVRCDSASYLIHAGAGRGCVFPWAATPTWSVHRSSTPQSAQNIWEAQNTPLATQPPSTLFGVPFKSIAGAPGVAPLHRDTVHISMHRSRAVAACRKYFPGAYPAPGTDCDEYPFASTQEGAANWGTFRNYVVKPISSKDNQDAGTQLGEFYAEQRLLGDNGINDPFYVTVQP